MRYRSTRRPAGACARADFRRYHGKDVQRLDGIAIMTDTDNSGTEGRAWYGDLSFRAKGKAKTQAGGGGS